MNRIIEAFTRPHYQLTAIDDILIGSVIVFAIAVCFVVGSIIMHFVNKE